MYEHELQAGMLSGKFCRSRSLGWKDLQIERQTVLRDINKMSFWLDSY